MKPGPKKGYKQSSEHIAARTKWGPDHHAWKGDAIIPKSGRSRAIRKYPTIGACQLCAAKRAERHHIDGNTANNDPSNIAIVCRKCHMLADGRLKEFIELIKRIQPRAIAARWNKTLLQP